MAERLKDMFFTPISLNAMADTLREHYSLFDKKKFLAAVYDSNWESLELKAKMRHATECLHKALPKSYKEALAILMQAAPQVKGFEAMTLPDYVALYGQEDWDLSLPALYHFTKYSTSELAIRSFLVKDPERIMKLMSLWAEDKDPKVRRLASEGCRPRLPWAMALPYFKKDPGLILPILEKLKNDESESVRRSVANNLNDISKDNPDIALRVCEQWYGKCENTDKIVKHACRGLLKAGNVKALRLFGYSDPDDFEITGLNLSKKKLKIGDDLIFDFELSVKADKSANVRLEYGIYYVKASGKSSKKVFKLTERSLDPGKHKFSRKQSFADMSTRQHYPGTHHISIIVNGIEAKKISFDLGK